MILKKSDKYYYDDNIKPFVFGDEENEDDVTDEEE